MRFLWSISSSTPRKGADERPPRRKFRTRPGSSKFDQTELRPSGAARTADRTPRKTPQVLAPPIDQHGVEITYANQRSSFGRFCWRLDMPMLDATNAHGLGQQRASWPRSANSWPPSEHNMASHNMLMSRSMQV